MKKKMLSGRARYCIAFGLAASFLISPLWPQEDMSRPTSSTKENSPDTAFLFSLLGTTLPFALKLAGNRTQSDVFSYAASAAILAGPSLGFFYGGLVGRGLVGVGLRALGAVLVAIGYVNFWYAIIDEDRSAEGVTIPFYAGAGIYVGSIIWDLATVKSAVRKRNDRIRERTLALSPFFNPRTRTAGLNLQFSF